MVKTKSTSTKARETKPTKTIKSSGQYDTPRNLAIGGVIGLVLTYIIITRALNTGSYWEYFFGIIILVISIRLFIRSLRLK